MGQQTMAVPNALFCDKSQWCISSRLFFFIHFLSLLCINYYKWEMSNDKAKVAKGDNLSRNITMAALNVHHRFRCVAGIERIWVLWRRLCHFIHVPDHEYFFNNAVGVCSKGENFIVANLSFTHVIVRALGITVLH